MKKVSILIALYNEEKYIGEAIESCLAQTYQEVEIIIVNDGSTDNSSDIVSKYCREYPKIRMITTANSGLASARNEGLKNATGDYLFFMDGDDWIAPTLISECVGLMKDEADVCFMNALQFENGTLTPFDITDVKLTYGKHYLNYEIIESTRKHTLWHQTWRGVYSATFLRDNNISFTNEFCIEDLPFWFEVMLNLNTAVFTEKRLYYYRILPNSITRSKASVYKSMTALGIAKKILKLIIDKKSLLKDKALTSFLFLATNKILFILGEMQRKMSFEVYAELKSYSEELFELKSEIIMMTDFLYCKEDKNTILAKYLIYDRIVFFAGIYNYELIGRYEKTRQQYKSIAYSLFEEWKLNENDVVGIYGCGRSATAILEEYSDVFGKINAELVFIDSYKKTGENRFLNSSVINCRDISKYPLSRICVASYLYEDDIVKSLKGINIPVHILDLDYSLESVYVSCGNTYEKLKSKVKDRAFLLYTAEYGNLGDHLITKAEHMFWKENCYSKSLIDITSSEYADARPILYTEIQPKDLLLVTGGGFLGSLWPVNGEVLEDMSIAFPDNKIIVFPQTLYFQENQEGETIRKKYEALAKNKNLFLSMRDKNSYLIASRLGFDNGNVVYAPDMALYFAESINNTLHERKGVCIAFRNDKEKIVTKELEKNIKDFLAKEGKNVFHTSMQYGVNIPERFNDIVLKEKMNEISSYEVMFTDTLHCMLMCLLTRTPCVAFDNLSKKVSGVFNWFNDVTYIQLANDEDFIMAYFRVKQADKGYAMNNKIIQGFKTLESIIDRIG